MSKENRTQTLIKVGTEEAFTHFNGHTSQDEASYDGDVSDADEEIKVVPDEVDDTQIEGLKPAEADSRRQGSSKSYQQRGWWQTLKSMDKKPVHKCSNRASSGSQDGPVCYNRDIFADGQKDQVSQGPYLCSLHSEGRQSASHELFQHVEGGTENV